jgi:GGDEF domain-containing protein
VLFRETDGASLLGAARREQPFLIVLAPQLWDEAVLTSVTALASHPDTRWTPVLLLASTQSDRSFLKALLEAGASALITLDQDDDLLHARLAALERSVLQVANLRSARFTDEQTGFYYKTFLEDQLKVFCRKQLRDGVAFCLIFLELRGSEENVQKAALHLAATVRGADLFGRWEDGLFAVLLPASGEEQARLLAGRFEKILEKEPLQARAALVVSSRCTVEPEALVESATNTLDAAWSQPRPLLWMWSERDGQGIPAAEPTA